MSDKSKCAVVIVGCGLPKRGMGWYHATNLLDNLVPNGVLTDIVEPYFLGAGKDTPGGKAFAQFVDYASVPPHNVAFHTDVSKVPNRSKEYAGFLALIAGRTADNPRLLKEVIAMGATHVYLEKPGAPTVKELEEMRDYADSKGIPVFMGYNKNVTKYISEARAVEAATPGATSMFIHNNAYKEEELPECFERNSEGMLKNMAVHELCVLVTFYDVHADNIVEIHPHYDYSRVLTLTGPHNGQSYTDFASVGFTLKTKEGKTVSVEANRTGGSFSEAIVSVGGKEVFRSKTPDAELEKRVNTILKENPDMMPYLPLQHDDYVELKHRCTDHIVARRKGHPEGVADIQIGIWTLKLAEKLTEDLLKRLAPGAARL